MLVIGLLLLCGAGYGGWMAYRTYFAPPVKDEGPPPPPPKPVLSYIRLAPITVSLIGKDRVEQIITVHSSLEVVAARQPEAQARTIKLVDALMQALYGAVSDGSALKGNVVDVAVVKAKLTEAAIKALGADIVQGVMVQVVLQRPV
jgi:hypothetical protein